MVRGKMIERAIKEQQKRLWLQRCPLKELRQYRAEHQK